VRAYLAEKAESVVKLVGNDALVFSVVIADHIAPNRHLQHIDGTVEVRLEPGASVPAHDHPAGEEVFVLEGDVRIGRYHMKAGDYLYTPPDAKHAAASDRGCVFLVTLPKPVVMLKDA